MPKYLDKASSWREDYRKYVRTYVIKFRFGKYKECIA